MNRLTKSAASVMLALSTFAFFGCEDDAPTVYGLNDAAQYGKITVTLEGTRPDGEDFTTKKTFRFMPEEGPEFSSVEFDIDTYFYVQRHHGAVNQSHNDNYSGFYLQTDAENTPIGGNFFLYTSIIDEDDNTFFYLNEYINIDIEDISSFSYDEETGKVKFKYTTEVDGEVNSTGFDLTITVDASVTVFEGLNDGGGGE
jgi:hypothetical protein